MAESDQKQLNPATQIIRDPKLVKNRIFIGNLPSCTREELESICHPYGKVLGSMVQKNFGFVQFDSEEMANKVASALTKSTFKGNIITVRNAGAKHMTISGAIKRPMLAGTSNTSSNNTDQNVSFPSGSANSVSDYNDCEIIVLDRKNTKYAEYIEDLLKRIKLHVDVLFPNSEVSLGKVLSNISSRGCLYAIVVANQNQEHNSITVNILQGQAAEHRNMPVEDAIKLIAEDYRNKLMRTAAQNVNIDNLNIGHLPKPVPIIPATGGVAFSIKERHPDASQMLLNLLASNMPLTVLQYDHIIKYLQSRRELQKKAELGATIEVPVQEPDPEIQLQKKILGILNKPSVSSTNCRLLYPSLQSAKDDARLIELLKDVRIQKALDSLLNSNLVTSVESYMKF